MADFYCDQTLATGANNGTSWDDAYQLLTSALTSFVLGDGDTLWVINNNATGSGGNLKGSATYTDDPPQVIGVKSGTLSTALPPAASDIIPGLRNGSSTRAYDQTGGDAPPIYTTTVAGTDIPMFGWMRVYGMIFRAADNFTLPAGEGVVYLEECEIRAGHSEDGDFTFGGASTGLPISIELKNCKVSAGTGGQFICSGKGGRVDFLACEIDTPKSPVIDPGSTRLLFDGCDFSAQSGTIIGSAGGTNPRASIYFNNTKIHASSALVTGSVTEKFRTEFLLTSSATGKTTGQTFQEIDIITDNGNIVEETARVRTTGADDGGSGAWSLAFTPNIDGTRDNREGLVGPRMAVEVVGDGTSQTLTVFIANTTASTDLDNDEVWLEAKSPPETVGGADYQFYTTQMDLKATPAPVTDDSSTWGSGANNPQKLQITLSPDYDGIIECWVVFAKNYGAAPETLYVDPLPVLS